MNPFLGAKPALADVQRQAEAQGMDGVHVDRTYRATEQWAAGTAMFDIVEATSVALKEPTVANVGAALEILRILNRYEAGSALRHARAVRMKEVNPPLLSYVKSWSGDYQSDALDALVEINGPDARELLNPILVAHLERGETSGYDGKAIATYLAINDAEQRKALLPVLLTSIKNGRGELPVAIRTYAQLNDAEARPELLRILKFHPSEKARTQAGIELVRLGSRDDVEVALKEERSDAVLTAVKKSLL